MAMKSLAVGNYSKSTWGNLGAIKWKIQSHENDLITKSIDEEHMKRFYLYIKPGNSSRFSSHVYDPIRKI